MSGLFSKPKVPKARPGPDPSDTANRRALLRNARLNEGGAGSTILTDAMAKAAPPRSSVTGMG